MGILSTLFLQSHHFLVASKFPASFLCRSTSTFVWCALVQILYSYFVYRQALLTTRFTMSTPDIDDVRNTLFFLCWSRVSCPALQEDWRWLSYPLDCGRCQCYLETASPTSECWTKDVSRKSFIYKSPDALALGNTPHLQLSGFEIWLSSRLVMQLPYFSDGTPHNAGQCVFDTLWKPLLHTHFNSGRWIPCCFHHLVLIVPLATFKMYQAAGWPHHLLVDLFDLTLKTRIRKWCAEVSTTSKSLSHRISFKLLKNKSIAQA